jgi:hypothetical protein
MALVEMLNSLERLLLPRTLEVIHEVKLGQVTNNCIRRGNLLGCAVTSGGWRQSIPRTFHAQAAEVLADLERAILGLGDGPRSGTLNANGMMRWPGATLAREAISLATMTRRASK